MKQISIILADDHPIVRQGLRSVIESEPDFDVVAEASDGLEAVEAVEKLRPQVVVLDLQMPHLNGLEVVQQVSKRFPTTACILLSMHRDESYVLQGLQHGAAAYVLKDANISDLVFAIREVVAGRRYLSPPLSENAIEAYVQKAKGTAQDASATLTNREREILHLAAEGWNNAQIAERLVISPRTAETHRNRVMRKLGLHSQSEIIRYALLRGIVTLDN